MTKTAREKSLVIYRLVKAQLDYAIRDDIETHAKLAAAEEGHRLWLAENSDIGMSRSPYNVALAKSTQERISARRAEWSEILDHTVEVFLDGKL